jgi:hypothetical protein
VCDELARRDQDESCETRTEAYIYGNERHSQCRAGGQEAEAQPKPGL